MTDRHQFRAKWHDYNGGIYFVTICTHEKRRIFGSILNGEIKYSAIGKIVLACLRDIPKHHNNVEVWNHVIMPNHIHMIIAVGAQNFAPAIVSQTNIGCLKPPRHAESTPDNHFNSRLAVILRSFKAAGSIITNRYMRAQNFAPLQIWQRNYHEHIIRNQHAFDNIAAYIDTNVENWEADCFNNNTK